MKEMNVIGQKRAETGKKATKLLRKEGLIPCNLYGEAKDENGLPKALSFACSFNELRKVVYTPHIYLVNLIIDGESHTAVMKELCGLAQGVRDGGRVALIVRKVNVTALYQNIPETLDIDVTNMKIGKSIKVGDLHYEGLEMATSKEVVVCTIKATRKSNAAAAEETEENAE